jgi:antitoxin CcdA
MQSSYDLSASKKPTNVTVNSDLLKQAKALDINLSAALEQTLIELVRQKQAAAWLAENRDAIDEYNRFVEENGTFADELRSF